MTNRQTKWSILTAEVESLELLLAKKKHYLEGLENTPCNLLCGGCNTMLDTEADFAKHFDIPNVSYLNLGDCPNSSRKAARRY